MTRTPSSRVRWTAFADITVDGQYTPVPVAANASDTSDGGASVVGAYQINTGLDTSVFGNGWGAGFWGRGTWGSGATIDALTDTLRLWTHDNFGEDLIINVYNGGIYYWDASASTPLEQRAVALSDLSGASDAPTVAARVLVSDTDRPRPLPLAAIQLAARYKTRCLFGSQIRRTLQIGRRQLPTQQAICLWGLVLGLLRRLKHASRSSCSQDISLHAIAVPWASVYLRHQHAVGQRYNHESERSGIGRG
jgi:hypothetical protein